MQSWVLTDVNLFTCPKTIRWKIYQGKELQQEEQEEQEAQAEEASSSVTANEEEETAEEDREEEEGEEGDNGENEAEEWVVSVYEYTKTPDTPEHSFDIGQKMKVVRRFPGGWLEVWVALILLGCCQFPMEKMFFLFKLKIVP